MLACNGGLVEISGHDGQAVPHKLSDLRTKVMRSRTCIVVLHRATHWNVVAIALALPTPKAEEPCKPEQANPAPLAAVFPIGRRDGVGGCDWISLAVDQRGAGKHARQHNCRSNNS